MDITLVQQAEQKTETVNGKEVKFIDILDISNLSKSSLRILYECGKRPLYSYTNSYEKEGRITVILSPQVQPDCLLCSHELNSHQSAFILKEQMSNVGIDFPIIQSEILSTPSNSKHKNLFRYLMKDELERIENRGVQHLIIVSDRIKLNTIYQMITNKNLPDTTENKSTTCLWSIRKKKPSYTYDPQIADFVTEGLPDSGVVLLVNNQNCPKSLKKFQGKIKKPIDEYRLLYTLRREVKSK